MSRGLLIVAVAASLLAAPARGVATPGVAWRGVATPGVAKPGVANPGATAAIFYYPWYGTPARDGVWQTWNQNGHTPPADLYSAYYPLGGPYSSGDPAVLDRQLSEIRAAGVTELIVSWWGPGSKEDGRLGLVVAAARRHGLEPAVHLEPYPGRSPETVARDLPYLASFGIRDVYVYHPLDFPAATWASLIAQAPTLRFFAATPLVGFALQGGFAGVYTYDFVTYGAARFARLCEQAHAVHLLCAPSVGPGYDGVRAGEPPVFDPRRNGATYDSLWRAALAARPDLVTITSFNEWGEGTQIEPAVARPGYRSYDGAWGLRGPAARTAYLRRTAYWTARLRALR